MIKPRSVARREVREAIPLTHGLPYDQPIKIGRFAAWVTYFRATFPDPYEQINNALQEKKITDFNTLEFALRRSLQEITGEPRPVRDDRNQFDLWAGGLTASIHTVSMVRTAPAVNKYFSLCADDFQAALRMEPAFSELVMEHQDRLGDIKSGLSEVKDGGSALGIYTIDPALFEITANGLVQFRSESLNRIPVTEARKAGPMVEGGAFVPNHGEEFVGDIVPRDDHIGCPISFVRGFNRGLLRATAEAARANELI